MALTCHIIITVLTIILPYYFTDALFATFMCALLMETVLILHLLHHLLHVYVEHRAVKIIIENIIKPHFR